MRSEGEGRDGSDDHERGRFEEDGELGAKIDARLGQCVSSSGPGRGLTDAERRGLADVGAGRAAGEHPPGGDAGEACEGEQQDAGLIAGGNGVFVSWRGSC